MFEKLLFETVLCISFSFPTIQIDAVYSICNTIDTTASVNKASLQKVRTAVYR